MAIAGGGHRWLTHARHDTRHRSTRGSIEHVNRVALVLGSGGARGYAHIGALQVLSERGYEVTTIAGSSMGAMVAGLHVTGKLEEYTDWVVSLTARDVRRLLDPVINGPGLVKLERVLGRVDEMLGAVQIEDLPIPYTAVATDLGARREVWFTSGPLSVAIRASVGIPALITPIMVNGRLLVDGGVLNPVPMEPVIGSDADFTMAISLSGPKDHAEILSPTKQSAAPRPSAEWLDHFLKGAGELWGTDVVASIMARFGKGEDAEPQAPAWEPPPAGLGIADVSMMSLDAMGAMITRFRLAALTPDVLVTVPGDAAKATDFHRAEEMIALGRRLTIDALDAFAPAKTEAPELTS